MLLNDLWAKAQERAQGLDLRALVEAARDSTPDEIATAAQKADRKNYLQTTLGGAEAQQAFERIIAGNELQPINYLEIGAKRANAVARIAIRNPSGTQSGWASGFLISPRLLLTNHHVFGQKQDALQSEVQFNAELNVDGNPSVPSAFRCLPEEFFVSDQKLDFAVVAIEQTSFAGSEPLSLYGYLPLVGRTGKVVDGEWLTIVQHPNGELKQLCIRENQLIKRTEDVLWYSTDTLGGSSGSPVFNNAWEVVALHHSGVPEILNGRVQTIDGRNHDPDTDPDGVTIKWIANEGIRVSRIVASLKQTSSDHPLIKQAFTENVVARTPSATAFSMSAIARQPMTKGISMSSGAQTIHLAIHLDSNGRATLGATTEATASAGTQIERPRSTESDRWHYESFLERSGIPDLSAREGYKPDFLGSKVVVHLPQLSAALQDEAAPLLAATTKNKFELRYDGYTVVVNKYRRWAIYSAANVRASHRFANLSGRQDRWLTDPRISSKHQVGDYYYKANKFDRGHLTRREDMEYGGSSSEATARADETCYFTNATPQHSNFNQNKDLWQGIERFLLEESIQAGNYDSQIVTGPVLSEDDPVYDRDPDLQYPVQFWKVISTLRADKSLFSTAYLLDQSETIAQFGIESTEVPFGSYKTFQVPISEIERLTGLRFTAKVNGKDELLSKFDPLTKPRRQRRKGRGPLESVGVDAVPQTYLPLESVWNIVKD